MRRLSNLLVSGIGALLMRLLRSPDREQVAKQLVRRFPWWFLGHDVVGQNALGVRDVALAYGAAQVLKNCPSAFYQARGMLLCARTHLQQGQHTEALALLKKLPPKLIAAPAVREDLAGAYLALGRREEALQELLAIPMDRRSAEGLSVIEYLRSVQQQPSGSGQKVAGN